jgi:hypothetical protein
VQSKADGLPGVVDTVHRRVQTPTLNTISTSKQGNAGNNIQLILTTSNSRDWIPGITTVESEADDVPGVVGTVVLEPAIIRQWAKVLKSFVKG